MFLHWNVQENVAQVHLICCLTDGIRLLHSQKYYIKCITGIAEPKALNEAKGDVTQHDLQRWFVM